MSDSFFDLISDVAQKEIQWVGQEEATAESMSEYAVYIECVRRIQIWTFERMASTQKEGEPMRKMFEELAQGVQRVPFIDLIMGEPGASGI